MRNKNANGIVICTEIVKKIMLVTLVISICFQAVPVKAQNVDSGKVGPTRTLVTRGRLAKKSTHADESTFQHNVLGNTVSYNEQKK